MPIEVVSVRVWAPALAENAFFNFVVDRKERDTAGIVRGNERVSLTYWVQRRGEEFSLAIPED